VTAVQAMPTATAAAVEMMMSLWSTVQFQALLAP